MIKFGIPKKGRKEERFAFPVLTLKALPTEFKSNSRLEFNKAAIELLGLNLDGNDYVSFGFNDEDQGFIVNATNTEIPEDSAYKVAKNGGCSNKKIITYLFDKLNVDSTQDQFFTIAVDSTQSIEGDTPLYSLTKWTETDDEAEAKPSFIEPQFFIRTGGKEEYNELAEAIEVAKDDFTAMITEGITEDNFSA